MTRVFENNTFARRLNIYVVILVVVILNGIWEIVSALQTVGGSTTGLAFGAVFIAGGIYGLYSTFGDGADLVALFETEPGGLARVTLWRPFRSIRLAAPLARIANWRFWVKTGPGGARTYLIYAEFPGYPRKLQFELRRGVPVPEDLRQIAPEAVADFEAATGARKVDEPPTA